MEAVILATLTCFIISFTIGTSHGDMENYQPPDRKPKENYQSVQKQIDVLRQDVEMLNHKMSKCDNELDKLKKNTWFWKDAVENKFEKLQKDLAELKLTDSEQVVFHARLTRLNITRGAVILAFNKVITNIGGGYDNLNGKFTAPSSGTYNFVCTFMKSQRTAPFYIDMRLNAEQISIGFAPGTGHREPGSMNAAVHMTKGDVVYVQTAYQRMLKWAFFSGFRLN